MSQDSLENGGIGRWRQAKQTRTRSARARAAGWVGRLRAIGRIVRWHTARSPGQASDGERAAKSERRMSGEERAVADVRMGRVRHTSRRWRPWGRVTRGEGERERGEMEGGRERDREREEDRRRPWGRATRG